MTPQADCPFCPLFTGEAPLTKLLYTWPETIALVPLNPVCSGHALIIPIEHVRDAVASPAVTTRTFGRAIEYAARHFTAFNLITSVGDAATQTVRHLHVHVVPRYEDDHLALPWTGR